MYAKRDATDQLRKVHSISITITNRERIGDVYCVTARAITPEGRTDESIGAVALIKEEKIFDELRQRKVSTGQMLPLTPEDLAIAVMKAETKAKRRVTLSLAGLGMMDESELETIEEKCIEGEENSSLTREESSKSALNSSITPLPESTLEDQKTLENVKTLSGPVSTERFKLLDFATDTSPGGMVFAKLKLTNITTGAQEVMIARSTEALVSTWCESSPLRMK